MKQRTFTDEQIITILSEAEKCDKTITALSKAKTSPLKIAGVSICLCLALLIGAGVRGGLLSGLSGFWLDVVLTFGVVALLYLVKAHEEQDSPLLGAMFFVGFTALLMVDMLVAGGH